ncbi:MAG: hypothetical protein ACP5LX_06535 [Nitrososphaeria archaeon]|jgi:membrane protein implicated in regulation of membrane protease activity
MAEISKEILIISLIVWVAVAASTISMVVFAGITGVVFAFVVLIVAVGAWTRMLRELNQKSAKQDEELLNEIKDLKKEIQELKKSLEE